MKTKNLMATGAGGGQQKPTPPAQPVQQDATKTKKPKK